MQAPSKAMKSDKSAAESEARARSEYVKKLLAYGSYEPPRVISFPTHGNTSLPPVTPVTMMANL
jgi:hypothetical protein